MQVKILCHPQNHVEPYHVPNKTGPAHAVCGLCNSYYEEFTSNPSY